MTPVISPWMIYFISICNDVKFVFIIATFICIIMFFVFLVDNDVFNKKIFVAFLVCGLFATFIPTSKTATKMVIAKNVTYERVDNAQDVVEKVYNDILSVVSDKKGE